MNNRNNQSTNNQVNIMDKAQNWTVNSMDDIIFEHRNKEYGAFILRRLYHKNMSKASLIGSLLFLLMVLSPQISRILKGFLPESEKEVLVMKEVFLAEPPPLDTKKPPPPPPPKVNPPPIKDQIKFVPPKVKKDEDVKEEEPPPPMIEEIKDKEIATETKKGEENGVDASLAEPIVEDAPPPPPVIEEAIENDGEPFTFVQQMPEFPDGQEALYKFIYGNYRYPPIARENGIQGTVVVSFTVSKDGTIKNAKVVRKIGGGCDEEALRVVNMMPPWKPGKHNGKVVPVTFAMPIKLVLQ